MRGLAARIHDEVRRAQALPLCPMSRLIMDCRDKAGNDRVDGPSRIDEGCRTKR
jgi:hypothetical protein